MSEVVFFILFDRQLIQFIHINRSKTNICEHKIDSETTEQTSRAKCLMRHEHTNKFQLD